MPNSDSPSSLYRQLKTEMNSVGRDLSESVNQVLEVLEQRNGASADELLEQLQDIEKREESLRELCLKILGRKSGNTPQLRWTGCAHRILSLMSKVSLEIGAILKQIGKIHQGPPLAIAEDLPEMCRIASEMLARSIQTALHPDVETARRVMEEDSCLDQHKDDFARKAITLANDQPEHSQPVVPYVIVSRHLERIGDHASHIAEEVAYYLQEAA
jgi:phosphate transport system protein